MHEFEMHFLVLHSTYVAMGRRKKLNIGHRMPKDSNQHVQASDGEGIHFVPTHTTSTNVQGSNVQETRSSPNHIENVMHESLESHSIPSSLEDEEVQIEQEPKRTRGPTRMLDVWEMNEGDFIIVKLDKYGRPIGEEATTLSRFIGSVVRRHQYAPINYKSWKVMPNEYKEEMLKLIEEKGGGDNGNKKWKLWRGSSESFGFGPSMKKGHCAPSFVDEDEAFNVAVATVIRAPHKDFMVIKKEWAAIRIQAVFRGFLARRALRALRAVVRLQAIFRGQQVRKQAAVTLRCMQALVRVQARVKTRKASKFPEGKAVQKLLDEQNNQADPVKQAEQGWCDIPGTAEEAKAKLKIRQRGAIKREKAMAYSHSTQQSGRCVSPNLRAAKPVTPLKHRSLDSKILLERWMAARPWEREEIYFDSPGMTPLSRKSDDLVPHFNSYQQNDLAKTRRNGVTTRISSKSLSTSQSTPSSSTIGSECMYDDSPVSTSCTSGSPSLPSNNTVTAEATEERSDFKPSYMNLTESTKAKLKACRSSQNLKSLLMDDCLSYSTKTDFLNGDTRSSAGSYLSFNSWKELYATPLRTSFSKVINFRETGNNGWNVSTV